MQRRVTRLLGILGAGVLALSLVGTAAASSHAMVRVLHASPDAPAVDVYLDDTIVEALTNVPFATISSYLEVPAGDHNVKVYATGTTDSPVIDADVSLAVGGMYTIAATDAVASISAQVLQDQPSPDCDGAQVRVVHFSADAPAVDVAPAGADPADAVVKNLEYPDATDYVALPAGAYDLEVRLAGTTTVALALPGVEVEDCNAYSVFAIGSAASPAVGDNALQVVVAVDATATAGGEAPGGGQPEPTPPATDTLTTAPAGTDQGIGAAAALLAMAAVAAFVATGRRLATRRVESDEA